MSTLIKYLRLLVKMGCHGKRTKEAQVRYLNYNNHPNERK